MLQSYLCSYSFVAFVAVAVVVVVAEIVFVAGSVVVVVAAVVVVVMIQLQPPHNFVFLMMNHLWMKMWTMMR